MFTNALGGSLANCSHTYGSLFQCSAPDLDLCRLPFPGSGASQLLPGLEQWEVLVGHWRQDKREARMFPSPSLCF